MSIPSDDGFLKDQANQLLSVAVAPFTGASAFGRTAVYIGTPPMDCEMLAVNVSALRITSRPTTTSVSPVRIPSVTTMDFSIMFLRCVTALTDGGNIPNASTIQAESDGLNEDAWKLWRAIVTAGREGTLFPDLNCTHLRIGNMTPITPQGGYGGYTMGIEVPLG